MDEFTAVLEKHGFIAFFVEKTMRHYLDSCDRMAVLYLKDGAARVKLDDPIYESHVFSKPNKLDDYMKRLIIHEAINV